MKLWQILVLCTTGVLSTAMYPWDGFFKCTDKRPAIVTDASGNQVKHGEERQCFDNGGVALTGAYKMGKKDGRWTNYCSKQELPTLPYSEEGFSGGLRDGKSTRWNCHSRIKREEGYYKNGKKEGVWREWLNNGVKASMVTFRNGIRTGKFTTWHTNGVKQIEGYMENDEIVGTPLAWRSDGKQLVYKNGDFKVVE